MAEITAISGSPVGNEQGMVTHNIPWGTQDVRLVASTASQAVTGTFWQATQPVSGIVTANQGGTWTVQPGNTANTIAWKIDGSGVTQPVSGTFWQATQPVSGTVTANQGGSNWSFNHAQTNGAATITSVSGIQDVMGRKRTGSTGLSPNYYSVRKTDKTTTTMTASTCYVQSIVYCCTGAGNSWTLQFKDKSATPLALTAAITLTASTTPVTVINLAEPIITAGGMDIITAGTTAGTVDIFVTYWQ